ncbi:putative RNA helicase [Helianthus anomalus]
MIIISLMVQNMEVLLKMGKFTGITSDLFIPADKANYIPVTAQVIIGTPGTINRLIAAKKLGTSHLKILVFEEADYLLLEVILWKFVSFFFCLDFICSFGSLFLNCGHGRILVGLWQGHGPGKFFGRSANFPHFDRNFLYILCLARACPGFF